MRDFYKDKTVFITGHNGFKGSWICRMLSMLGAKVIGYSLEPPTNPNLYQIAEMDKYVVSINGDIRDLNDLSIALCTYRPDIVIHMAAQPIVRLSYTDPVYTYSVNVMGTVNLFEAIRKCDSIRSVINITTDKVYENNEWVWGYREGDRLNGFDPYSNSKSCSELITSSYKQSFLSSCGIAVSTCRAGNVIGGGDFASDRIIPDAVRAIIDNRVLVIRNPYSIRPYQHVLEPLYVYLMIAKQQYEQPKLQGCYNIGPDEEGCIQTGVLAERFYQVWGQGVCWRNERSNDILHEANYLKLDCSLLKSTFHWKPKMSISRGIERAVEWYKTYLNNGNIADIMGQQIKEHLDC